MQGKSSVVTMKRKNLVLDQAKINRAKRIFGATSETEAITRALDQAADLEAFSRELEQGLEGLVGKGGFKDQFGQRTHSR